HGASPNRAAASVRASRSRGDLPSGRKGKPRALRLFSGGRSRDRNGKTARGLPGGIHRVLLVGAPGESFAGDLQEYADVVLFLFPLPVSFASHLSRPRHDRPLRSRRQPSCHLWPSSLHYWETL